MKMHDHLSKRGKIILLTYNAGKTNLGYLSHVIGTTDILTRELCNNLKVDGILEFISLHAVRLTPKGVEEAERWLERNRRPYAIILSLILCDLHAEPTKDDLIEQARKEEIAEKTYISIQCNRRLFRQHLTLSTGAAI